MREIKIRNVSHLSKQNYTTLTPVLPFECNDASARRRTRSEIAALCRWFGMRQVGASTGRAEMSYIVAALA
jgi:hypothetical protein